MAATDVCELVTTVFVDGSLTHRCRSTYYTSRRFYNDYIAAAPVSRIRLRLVSGEVKQIITVT